jgi:ArsR family transcriptional regulator
MDTVKALKAMADVTRMKMLTLLLRHGFCVRGLAHKLNLTEATISQHLKVLREAGLIVGEKRGYFMHYNVERSLLCELASEIQALGILEREACELAKRDDCPTAKSKNCPKGQCGDRTMEFCYVVKQSNKEG